MKATKRTHEQRKKREREMITTEHYRISTPVRDYHTSGTNWRQILQMLKCFGYNAPISACRDLWKGEKIVRFNGVEIEDLFYTFNK